MSIIYRHGRDQRVSFVFLAEKLLKLCNLKMQFVHKKWEACCVILAD